MMAQSRRWRKVMVLLSCQVLLARAISAEDEDAYLVVFVDGRDDAVVDGCKTQCVLSKAQEKSNSSSQNSHTTPRPAQPPSAWRHHRDTTETADSLCGCRRDFYITAISSKKRASLHRGVRSIGRRTKPEEEGVWFGKRKQSVKAVLESNGASCERVWTPIVPSFTMSDVCALQNRQASALQSFYIKQERLHPESPMHNDVSAREGSVKLYPSIST